MRRFMFPGLLFAGFAFVISITPLSAPTAAESVAQCMSSCIKHEGNTATAKSTCKMRCANVAVPAMTNSNAPDCMATYKACNRACDKKDKACQRQCKSGLMGCK